MTGPLPHALATRGLVAGYEPGLPIVNGVDLAVAPGEFVAIIGPNGAGKSTLVKAIAGMVPIHAGAIYLAGQDLTATGRHQRVRHRLAFVPQTENVFATLTIRENLQIAAQILPAAERQRRMDDVWIMFPDLAARPKLRAGKLSGGQRQMLAVARALVVAPTTLILDEPSAGLSPRMVSEVFMRLDTINRSGVTIILVEQNVKAALALARRALILVEGRVRHEGPAASLGDDPILAELYLGRRRGVRP